jgi:hypothetical protein
MVSKMALAVPNSVKIGNNVIIIDLKVDFENLFM